MICAMIHLDNYLVFQLISLFKLLYSIVMKSCPVSTRTGQCEEHFKENTYDGWISFSFSCDAFGLQFSIDEATSQCIQKREQRLVSVRRWGKGGSHSGEWPCVSLSLEGMENEKKGIVESRIVRNKSNLYLCELGPETCLAFPKRCSVRELNSILTNNL